MSRITLRRERAGDPEEPRPAAFLVDAMVAVLEGEPGRAILLADDVYVRAGFLVELLAPEAFARAAAFTRQTVAEQVGAYV